MNSKIVILTDSVILYQHYTGNDDWESVMAFPRGGLTYLIKNNNIKFYAYVDYFYRNCLMTMDLPIYVIDEEMGIDGEYDDIEELTEILNRIFPASDNSEGIDLTPYLRKAEAEETYQPIGFYFDEVDYDSSGKTIDFYSDGALVDSIDATEFIKDGMVDHVELITLSGDTYLHIVFNTDAGKEPIDINLGDLFNADNYYTKDETDDLLDEKLDASAYTPVDLSDYYTKQEVDDLIPEVPSLSGYATELWVENKGYLTEHQPLKTINGYSLIGTGNIIIEGGSGGTIDAYTKTEADNRFQPIGNYATEDWVLNKNYVTYSTLVQNITNIQEQINYLISEISGCCGSSGETQYRWITMTGENDYICFGVTKYSKEKKQQSTDGIIWTDVTPAEYRTGEVIEAQSTDCGYTGDTTIVGDAEYRKQDLSGDTWPIHITYSGDPSQITYDYSYPSESVSNNRGLILDKSTGTITLSGGVCYMTSKMAWFRISVKVNGSEVKRVTVYPEDKYITLTGQYACDGYNKYQLYQEQHSYDNSTWCDWSTPTTRDNMTLLEENSVDCGYVPPTPEPQYRWYQAPASDYICSGTSKYYKEYYQVSNDGGQTWSNVTPTQTRQGSLIENQSTDCGYIAPQYRWYQAPASDYMCSGTSKYYKEYYQVSYDGGSTWQNVTPTQTRRGSLIEEKSADCGYEPTIEYRWVTVSGEYVCSGTTKYNKEKKQYRIDGGAWTDTNPLETRRGSTVIEAQSTDCGYDPNDHESHYLTFEVLENGTQFNYGKSIYYSTNNGISWTNLSAGNNTPSLSAGSKIMWKKNILDTLELPSEFGCNGKRFNVEGNIMSVVAGDNFRTATSNCKENFDGMFKDLLVVSAANLVMPTSGCMTCMDMFSGCTALTSTPVLSSTTLSSNCYYEMFKDCTSLTTAPQLPATNLTHWCYVGMFDGCSSLATAPSILPATTLSEGCYSNMFRNCTSLRTAPELPASTLTSGAYDGMFYGCTSLNYIKCLATNISATPHTTQSWVYHVASSGTFVKKSTMTSWTTGINGIPSGWTVQNA